MIAEFYIQDRRFTAETEPDVSGGILVASVPRPYRILFETAPDPAQNLARRIAQEKHPLLLMDRAIHSLYFAQNNHLAGVKTFLVDARETVKNIETSLSVVSFLEAEQATKATMLYVVGGGIAQDVGGFAAAIYKRGLPWTFVPTTLLGQCDSCLGGKTALNHKETKNLLGLFAAPRQVVVDVGFLKTMPEDDFLSGAGEIFRLCVTGGPSFLSVMEASLPAFLTRDEKALRALIATTLSSKRAVVEVDEFELDLRRSMNYGHSFGHAIEALTHYAIPHGVGVALGILVENEISFRRGMLPREERDRLLALGRKIIPASAKRNFAAASLDGVIELFRRDKKAEGAVLKLATLERIGRMRFIDFQLSGEGEAELRRAVDGVLEQL